MPYKAFYKKVGYETTKHLFLEGKPFIRGIGEHPKVQMLELLCQFELCRINVGYGRSCQYHRCMGVPACSEKEGLQFKRNIKNG